MSIRVPKIVGFKIRMCGNIFESMSIFVVGIAIFLIQFSIDKTHNEFIKVRNDLNSVRVLSSVSQHMIDEANSISCRLDSIIVITLNMPDSSSTKRNSIYQSVCSVKYVDIAELVSDSINYYNPIPKNKSVFPRLLTPSKPLIENLIAFVEK